MTVKNHNDIIKQQKKKKIMNKKNKNNKKTLELLTAFKLLHRSVYIHVHIVHT